MSLLSLRQVLAGETRDQVLTQALEFLEDLGFNLTSWQVGSVQRTLLTAFAWIISDSSSSTLVDLAANARDTTATGAWLDVVSTFYNNTRIAATATEGTVTLTSASGSPTATWSAGELLLSQNSDGTGQLYRITEAGSITAGNTDTFDIQAVETGAAGNIAAGDIYFVSPLTGITAELVNDSGTGTWITTPGTDLESDKRLQERNSLEWSQLAYGANRDAYKLWALEADSTVTRVNVVHGGSGAVSVYCATAVGGTSSGQNATIQAYVDDRHPSTDTPTVASASTVNVTFTLAPTIQAGTTTVADIQSTIQDYLAEIPIGGAIIAPVATGRVVRDEIIERLMALPGMKNVNMSAPSGDTSIGSTKIPVAVFSSISPTYVA